MAPEPWSHDELYAYHGPRRVNLEPTDTDAPGIRNARQDSAVNLASMTDVQQNLASITDVMHDRVMGTLFVQRTNEDPSDEAPAATSDESAGHEHSQLVAGLRSWWKGFSLASPNPGSSVLNETATERPILTSRRRSLSLDVTQAMRIARRMQLPSDSRRASSAAPALDETVSPGRNGSQRPALEESTASTVVKRPTSPIQGTPEWDQRENIREEYRAIERAREMRIMDEIADNSERNMRLMCEITDWHAEEQDRKQKQKQIAVNLARFEAMTGNANGTLPEYNSAIRVEPEEEKDLVEEELNRRSRRLRMTEAAMEKDRNTYVIPMPWNMRDRELRRQLYSNPRHLERYLKHELRTLDLLDRRIAYLQNGYSRHNEYHVQMEIEDLEEHAAVHQDAESNCVRLVYDLLWAGADQIIIEMEHIWAGTPLPPRPSFTSSLSRWLMLFIANHPRLVRRYRQVRIVEEEQFPERFQVKQPRRRTSARLTSFIPSSDGSQDFEYPREFSLGQKKKVNTLPPNWREEGVQLSPKRLVAIRLNEGAPDFPRPWDQQTYFPPTSPKNPPESGDLRSLRIPSMSLGPAEVEAHTETIEHIENISHIEDAKNSDDVALGDNEDVHGSVVYTNAAEKIKNFRCVKYLQGSDDDHFYKSPELTQDRNHLEKSPVVVETEIVEDADDPDNDAPSNTVVRAENPFSDSNAVPSEVVGHTQLTLLIKESKTTTEGTVEPGMS